MIDAIFTDFYTDKRNAIFHAKVHRTHFLPRNPNEHAIISSSLDRLVRLYLDLVEKGLGVRRLAGLMTVEGFNQLIAPQMQSLEIRASDDTAEANVNQIEVNPNGGTVISLQTRDAPELDLPMTKFLFGTIPAHELQDLQRLEKVSLNQNEILLSVGAIGGELTLDGIAELQVQMGVRVENKQMPKSIYVS